MPREWCSFFIFCAVSFVVTSFSAVLLAWRGWHLLKLFLALMLAFGNDIIAVYNEIDNTAACFGKSITGGHWSTVVSELGELSRGQVVRMLIYFR
jgi:hypothetical protein